MTDLFDEGLAYSIDSSSLIDLGRIYRIGVFPTVWAYLEHMIGAGLVRAVDEVLRELSFHDDVVFEWARKQGDLFMPLSEDVQRVALTILADHPGLVDLKKRDADADPWVIALAKVHGAAVVAEENPSRNADRPKIPDVCRALGIEYMSIADVLEREGVSL